MAHYMPSLSGTEPFPLVKKPHSEASAIRALRIRIWLSRLLFVALFAGVVALLVYEAKVVKQLGWRATVHKLISK
jgi:hypothetical protein